MRIALVVSSYHDFVTTRLETGARALLRERGVADSAIETYPVPGAYELAQAAHRLRCPDSGTRSCVWAA